MALQPFDLEIRALLSQRKLVAKYLKQNPNVRVFRLKANNADIIIDKAKVSREIIRRKLISGLNDEAKSAPNKLIEFLAAPSNTKVVEQALKSLSEVAPTVPTEEKKESEATSAEAKKAKEKKEKKSSTSPATKKQEKVRVSSTQKDNKTLDRPGLIVPKNEYDGAPSVVLKSQAVEGVEISNILKDREKETGKETKFFYKDRKPISTDEERERAEKILNPPTALPAEPKLTPPQPTSNSILVDRFGNSLKPQPISSSTLILPSQSSIPKPIPQPTPAPTPIQPTPPIVIPTSQKTAKIERSVPYPVKNTLKNLLSFGQIQVKKLVNRFPKAIMAGGATGAAALFATQGNLLAAAGGFAAGALGYQIISSNQSGTPQPTVLNNEDTSPQSNQSAPASRGFSNPLSAFNNARKGLNALKGAATAARAGVLLTNPIFWIIIAILILILIVVVILNGGGSSDSGSSSTQNKIEIIKTGPAEVKNGEQIPYKIEVTYKGTGTADIEITDKIDPRTVFESADKGGTHTQGTVKWKVASLANGQKEILSLIVRTKDPGDSNTKDTEKDFWAVNMAEAIIAQVYGAKGGFCPGLDTINSNRTYGRPQDCKYLNVAVDIFDTNISNESIETYIKEYKDVFISRGGGAEADLRAKINKIIEVSKQAGFNPIIILGLWRTESTLGTDRGAAQFGCDPFNKDQSTKAFEYQLQCAVGNTKVGSLATKCARSKDAKSQDCIDLAGIRAKHQDIYKDDPITIPIKTFDDFVEAYGPRSPKLAASEGVAVNNNCINTYNILAEIAIKTSSCLASSAVPANLAQCKFTKGDQNPKALPFQSQKLLSYFQEVANKTGVPAALLASVARVESTTSKYTISNYTDEDIALMDQTGQITADVDKTITGSEKALCPRSLVGALGIMQVQPGETVHNQMRNELLLKYGREQKEPLYENEEYNRAAAIKPFNIIKAHDENAVALGAKFAGINRALTREDYCNPRTNIYIAAGFIIKKLSYKVNGVSYGDGTKWDSSWNTDKEVINTIARRYYGALTYGPNDEYNYGDDILNSINQCKEKVAPPPGPAGFSLTCPLSKGSEVNYKITCGSFANPTASGCGHGREPGYDACIPGVNAGPNLEFAACAPGGGHTESLKNAIDIGASSGPTGGKPVYLPFINGNASVIWKRLDPGGVSAGANFGYKIKYQTTFQGKTITIDLTHISEQLTNNGAELPSGTQVATIYSGHRYGDHLHTALLVNGVPIDPIGAASMCGDN